MRAKLTQEELAAARKAAGSKGYETARRNEMQRVWAIRLVYIILILFILIMIFLFGYRDRYSAWHTDV